MIYDVLAWVLPGVLRLLWLRSEVRRRVESEKRARTAAKLVVRARNVAEHEKRMALEKAQLECVLSHRCARVHVCVC